MIEFKNLTAFIKIKPGSGVYGVGALVTGTDGEEFAYSIKIKSCLQTVCEYLAINDLLTDVTH